MRHRASPEFIGSAIAYRWRSPPRFRRHRASSPQYSIFGDFAFSEYFLHLPFSLCMESTTSYVLSFRMMVSFYLMTTGWNFYIIISLLCENLINQSNSINESNSIYQQGSSRNNGCCHFAGHHGPINVRLSFPTPTIGMKCVMCVCVVIPFVLDVRSVDVPAGVIQEEGHTRFLHLPSSAVLALIFLARRIQSFLSLVDRRIQSFLSLVDRDVEIRVLTI